MVTARAARMCRTRSRARSSKNSKVMTRPALKGSHFRTFCSCASVSLVALKALKQKRTAQHTPPVCGFTVPHFPPPQTDKGQRTQERPRPATDLCPGSLNLSPAASRGWWGDWKGRLCPRARAFGKSQGVGGETVPGVSGSSRARDAATPGPHQPGPELGAWPAASLHGENARVCPPRTLTPTPAHVRALHTPPRRTLRAFTFSRALLLFLPEALARPGSRQSGLVLTGARKGPCSTGHPRT